MVSTFEFVDEILKCDHSNDWKLREPLEHDFPVVLFIIPYTVVITLESVEEILK